MADPAAFREAAVRLRRVRIAQADGGTWAQVAPLLGCTDGPSAKREAHRLERALRPVAHQMAAARAMAERIVPDPYQQEVIADEPMACGPWIAEMSGDAP